MKGGWGLIAVAGLALVALAPPSFAGTIYRCDTADGQRSYVSKRVPGATCKAVTSYRSSSASAQRPPPAASGGSAIPASASANPPATFMGGGGSGATSAPAPAPAVTASSGSTPQRRLQQGQVYSYVKDGVRHYTSQPPRGGVASSAVRTIRYSFFETCYACAPLPGVNFGTVRLNTTAYAAEIKAAAAQFGVEEAIVRAIMHAESAFNPNALSRAGAQGLMQLMPATARRFGVANPYDPAQNIRGGVEYLAWLLKRYNGDLTLAAAGYNAGEGAVDRYKGVPPYSETQRYVVRVAQLAERYRGHLAANN
ncbi:Soluble lytic murein transglycosylase and related regulatory proteins (some containing LysM/invasin domains) [Luteimonas sp. J16]|jgi:soluble lytic murein transglycosylase-like protein|uniref:lytic transglycosylase domain-containing protein n=1 Tax=unclassified Luteimonas TaxID=2629088 RepID=UPI00047B12DC|nr:MULTISPECIES: lytic transglycosylase domain-containing protein [unclassified Luteimonas]TWG94308.1 Soluble lytic murein transglycosylase and related regulatory proteins (some containing LysM/invasin domains) [Luteimonas sp. J16]